jgi:N-acetylglucosamine-6-phosphate deacetylase
MSSDSVNVHVIRGNVVTPAGVLYGGHLQIVGEVIHKVCASDVPVPTAEDIRQSFPDARNVSISIVDAPFVAPGFVDIHNHGAGGSEEVCDHWLHPEFSQKYFARCGTLSTLASVIFSQSRAEVVGKVVASIEARVGKYFEDCCSIEGIHAEGPVINDRGGLPPANTNPTLDEFKALCASMPSMKIMTISPTMEALSGYKRLQHLVDIGVRPSLGHDRECTESAILGALLVTRSGDQKGVKTDEKNSAAAAVDNKMHSTHIFNVMSFHHRSPSLINFLLCKKFPGGTKYRGAVPPTVEIIADFIHVHPVVIQSVLSARDPSDVAIISDCISMYEPGRRLKYNGRTIAVRAEGGCYLCDQHGSPTKTLAGSTVTLADQFFSLITHFGLDVATACLLLATTPAKIAKIGHRVGSLEVGKKANVLLINGEMNTIVRRMVYGHWISGEPYRMLKPSVSHL